MDSLWNTAYGIDADILNNSNNEYFNKCETMFIQMTEFNMFMYLGGA